MWFYLLVGAIGLLWYYMKKSYSYWDNLNVPVLPPTFPFGHLDPFGRKHFAQILKDAYDAFKKKSDFSGFYFLTSPRLIPLNLDVIKHILIKDFNNFSDRQVYYNEEDDPLSAHLFSLRGDKWRSFRQQLSPTFTSGKMKMMYPLVVGQTEPLNQYLRKHMNSGPMDFKAVCTRYAADVIGIAAFGIECNCLKHEKTEILRMSDLFFNFNTIMSRLKFFFFLTFEGLAKKMRLRFNDQELEDYFMRIIKDTVKHRESGKVDRNDFVKLLLQVKNNKENSVGNKMTFNEMAAQAFIFFVGGYETTSMTMQYCCGELARNQDMQERVRQEVREVLKKYNGELTYEAVHELTYLKQCIDETLRMYPPGFNLFRAATNDYKVPNSSLLIPKGMQIFIPVYAIHMDPEIYPNPHIFDPERFSAENVQNRHPMAHIPFGDGPRNCIGMRFAMMELAVAISNIVNNFKLTLNPRTQTPFKFDPKEINIYPEGGMWIDVQELKA
ncbi:cytochrome P450 6a2-like [Phlebotomus argentipes]|uniref:cytochrome P450 6a2-like n=1 Tax=Phlebotomus argentipes TaxID=94469 RepID=UPI002893295A|nr:cytochrome P450 6a2-like [Phlebotomus argentipes]